MEQAVTIQQKKSFLKWLTNNHKFRVRESLWILDYLYNHESMLGKTHFVEEVEQTPRGIYMSVAGVDEADFVFYKNGRSYNDPVQAFHEVRLNWSSELFLEIAFTDAWQSTEYLTVLEDNPHAPWNQAVSADLVNEMKQALQYETLRQAKEDVLQQIDEALQVGDREQFNELSAQFDRIEKLMNECISND